LTFAIMQTPTSRVKAAGKSASSQTTRNFIRIGLAGFFAGVVATRQFMAATVAYSAHHNSADNSFAPPPDQDVAYAREVPPLRKEKIRDVVAATEKATVSIAANNLRQKVEPENTTRSEIADDKSKNVVLAGTPPVNPTEATGKVSVQIENNVSENRAHQEEVVAKKTPSLDTSLATGNITIASGSDIKDFERQKGVVIAVKIHGPPHVKQLKQSLCLLNAAYNNRPHYDHIIFTTLPLSDDDVIQLKEIVHPAFLSVETDKQSLNDQIDAMTQSQKEALYKMCNKTLGEPLHWASRCSEGMPLAYSWQSEFRSKHIWRHQALEKYKYMMWYDSDAMATRVWHHDPVSLMVRNDLAILFANFPQGSTSGSDLRERIVEAYNDTLCSLKLKGGRLLAKGGHCLKPNIPQVHGFFHVTNLDFYRSPENLRWADIMIGDTKFSRRWDDQLAVTVPAAMRAPERSWEMEANGVKLDVWHNGMLDGKTNWKGGGYQKWWQKESAESFPEAVETCKSLITNGGR
jgi:tellurite resistance protein